MVVSVVTNFDYFSLLKKNINAAPRIIIPIITSTIFFAISLVYFNLLTERLHYMGQDNSIDNAQI